MKAHVTEETSQLIKENSIRRFLRENSQTISIFGVLIIISILFSLFTNSFFTVSNITNVLVQIAPSIIVAVVMTYVITTGGIDLSVGSVLALSSALTAVLLANGFSSFTTLLIVLISGVLIGLLHGYVIAYLDIPPLIVTLAGLMYVRGIALLITGGYSIAISREYWLVESGQGLLLGIPIPIILALTFIVLGIVVLRNTKYGTYVTGIGANEEAVHRVGVNTRKIKIITYIFSSVSAVIAGIIIASRLGSGSSNIGNMFELDVIAAVVLGGTALFGGSGTVIGSVIGVALIGIIKNGLTLMHVSPYLIQIVQGLVLLIAVIINVRVFRSGK